MVIWLMNLMKLQIEDILKQELEESKRFVKLKYRDYLRDNL